MPSVNQKIIRIIEKDLCIKKQLIPVTVNLISEFNLCEWELELLYFKIEQAFKIDIKGPTPKDDLNVLWLSDIVKANYAEFKQRGT